LPAYSVGEAFVWFRFPLFAMAVAFWLGRDKRMINAMLLSVGLGMVAMCVILAAEILIVGANQGRLSWPYGDLVPGNYLAKACLPAFVVVVAIATSSNGRTASWAAIIALISIVASVMTGERVNFLIRACSSMLAAIAWRPRLYRVIAIFAVEGIAILTAIMSAPGLVQRFVDQFLQQLPTHGDSPYFRAMAPGWLAFQEAPLFGIGPGNLRLLCDDIIAGSSLYDCHPHPHNFYLQMLGEAGIIGFLTGVLFLVSVIWACARPALRDRSNVVVATMWIVPFGFFWPIASTADFFGQWNNIFMWSAIAVALAGAQIGSQIRSDTKT
jgi:O-antigen ligase